MLELCANTLSLLNLSLSLSECDLSTFKGFLEYAERGFSQSYINLSKKGDEQSRDHKFIIC